MVKDFGCQARTKKYLIFWWEGVGTSNFTTTTGHFFQNIENVCLVHHYYYILVDHNYEIDKIRTSKLTKITTTKVVDHYYENQNVEKNEKNIESLSFVWFSNLNYLWRNGILAKKKI